MSISDAEQAPLKVYWQPGCSSCLKTKEFLIDNGFEFISVNVLEDESGFAELGRMARCFAMWRGSRVSSGAAMRCSAPPKCWSG